MTSLWWPGDERAGDAMSEAAFLRALATVEAAWLEVLVEVGAAPAVVSEAAEQLRRLEPPDAEGLARAAEAGGNPVIPWLAATRPLLPAPAGEWLHRGLTSQDVVDTALVLCARDAVAQLSEHLDAQVRRLAELAVRHRDDPTVARTLTQHAVPTTFGARVATWLHAVLDAAEELAGLAWPVQLGGAAGTLAGVVELAGEDGARSARSLQARRLGLGPAAPWHTRRAPITRVADAVVRATAAWGTVANDVLTLGRPELGEVTDGSAGGSSTMPGKANPVLAVLVRRTALAAPGHASVLHRAAADQVDERADGAWHAEWRPLATLLREAVATGSQVRDLLDGLQVHPEVMRARLGDVLGADGVPAEQAALAEVAGRPAAGDYLGLAHDLVDEAVARSASRTRQEETA